MLQRYLVTGRAGFVGSHVVLALLDRGHEVVWCSTTCRKGTAPLSRLRPC